MEGAEQEVAAARRVVRGAVLVGQGSEHGELEDRAVASPPPQGADRTTATRSCGTS